MNSSYAKHTGFSLIEVLVSLVVMSVGMMGLAGLKMVSIKGTNEAHFRHEASLFMADLVDRMRANEAAVDNGSYKVLEAVDISSEPSPNCSEVTCSADDLAAYDQYQIAFKMSAAMPGSLLSVTCPNNSCKTVNDVKVLHNISINWKVKKDKSESLTRVVDGASVKDEFNERRIRLTVTP